MFSSDAATDAITHFIGLFELADLRTRLRLDYDELAATTASVVTGKIASLDLTVQHSWQMRDISPLVRYVPPDTPPGEVVNGARLEYVPVPLRPLSLPALDGAPLLEPAQLDHAAMPLPLKLGWELPPPPSVAVMIVQHGTLYDNDLIDADKMDGAVAQNVLMDTLDALAQTASLAGIAPGLELPASEGDFTVMALQLQCAEVPVVADGHAFTATGADAHGSFLDGVGGAERPELDDLLPAHWKELAARGEDDGPTHEIVHGGNLLVNDVVLTASWISAPVMVVGGASMSFDMISQVNVWQDIDQVVGLAEAAWAGGGTNALNMASITHTAHPIPEAIRGDGAAPAFWAITTIEGSLINFNWVEQRNFISDNDVTSITLTGAKTTMILGGNQSENAVSLFELGSQFDVIIVDGNLINIAGIFQTNVLLDSDHVTMGQGGRLSSGDNLLLNDASILQVGQGTHLPAQGGWLDLLTEGADALSGMLDDPAFAGFGALRVLHIKGDLVSAQIIQQLNILGDADQVDLLAERAMENASDVAVVTGSNVLVNSAHIGEFGIDSTIHTRGGIYSDALIHQAELVDTASPYASPGLASEAVVFLAEGMTGAGASDDLGHGQVLASDHIPVDPMQTVLA